MKRITNYLTTWSTQRRIRAAKRRLISQRDEQTLQTYLKLLIDHDTLLNLDDRYVRDAVFSMDGWKVYGACGEYLFVTVQQYLFKNCRPDHKSEWLRWVRNCRLVDRQIGIALPNVATALRLAHTQGLLCDMPEEDRVFLLMQYKSAYASILSDRDDITEPTLLAALLNYATVLHEIGIDDTASKFLKRVSKNIIVSPRSLAALTDAEALDAPECGIGSPHRIGITIYHDPDTNAPVRITGAGTTADATLTARVFTNVFAAALSCNAEPTIVTLSAWSLTLTPQAFNESHVMRGRIMSAVLTPSGAGEPTGDTPTLGISPEEALTLIADSFERLQEETGLVRVMRWESSDATYVDERIRSALHETLAGTRIIRSEPRHTEGNSVIHVMPLLHREADGRIIPVEIEIPYQALGPKLVFGLLREGRCTYMNQLIAAAHSREKYAKNVWEEQCKMIHKWMALSDEEKANVCSMNPTVTITRAYDWDLGIDVPLDKPEHMPRNTYEEEQRPAIRESAKRAEVMFAEISAKLEEMNKPGGKAEMVTFKLLIDAMIRRALLPIPNKQFQDEYQKWIEVNSVATWAVIDGWAKKRGLSGEVLAADNICFNAHVDPDKGSVLLHPMVVFDLHDFIARIDGDNGLMEVIPAGRTPTLSEALQTQSPGNITTLADLHARFVTWLKEHLPLIERDENGFQSLESQIISDGKIGVVIKLYQAKLALFNGKPDDALATIGDIRRYDLAPIYFWGAVTEQYQQIADVPYSDLPSKPDQRRACLINMSVAILIDSLKAGVSQTKTRAKLLKLRGTATSLIEQSLEPSTLMAPKAAEYLEQLRACDPDFVNGLTAEKPDIEELEQRSLSMSDEDQRKRDAALSALSAIELLSLAENIKNMAKTLPYSGRVSTDVKKGIRMLIQKKKALSLAPQPSLLELEELEALL